MKNVSHWKSYSIKINKKLLNFGLFFRNAQNLSVPVPDFGIVIRSRPNLKI